MSKETKPKEIESKSKEKDRDILDDFKKEVFERGHKSALVVFGYLTLILIVFGLLGIATYQIFLKPEKTDNKASTEKIENRPVVQEEEKKEEKPAETPKTEQPAPTPTPQPSVIDYTVQSGDTWSSIANANGMSSADLMKYNNTTSEDLQIGQTIKIPKS